MTAEFDAVVQLSRLASQKRSQNGELTLHVLASSQVDSLLSIIHSWVAATKYNGDREYFDSLSTLARETIVRVVLRPIVSDRRAVFQSLDELLSYQYGKYQSKPPEEFYLLDEDFARGERHPPTAALRQFFSLPALKEFLKFVSDFDSGVAAPTYVILAEGRIDIPFRVTAEDLQHLPNPDWIAEFLEEVSSPPLSDAKKRIVRRVMYRFLNAWPSEQRCGQLARSFVAIRESYAADYTLFESDFNFDKLKEDFQRKQSDYLSKLGATTTDAMSKLLAIPVAQGLLASQMKAGQLLLNSALLAGSVVFAIIAVLVLINQRSAAEHILSEVKKERTDLQQRYPEQYTRLSASYRVLVGRAETSTWMPLVLGVLLLVLTAFTAGVFVVVSNQPPQPTGVGVVTQQFPAQVPSFEGEHDEWCTNSKEAFA